MKNKKEERKREAERKQSKMKEKMWEEWEIKLRKKIEWNYMERTEKD